MKNRTILSYIGIFVCAAAIFAYVEWQPSFKDPDSFYHAKLASLMLERGVIRDFPWLPYTTLAAAFADHHFLYHVALLPFVAVFGALLGAKIATVVFAALAVTVFYALLRAYHSRWPWFFALALATSAGFLFRAGLAKAQALALAAVFLALIFLRRRQAAALAILSFLFVWLYGGWPIMLLLLAAAYFSRLTDRRTVFASIAGLFAGFVLNPYFPDNLSFYWEQFVQIAVVGYQSKIAVGSEWYGMNFPELLAHARWAIWLLIFTALVMLDLAFWDDVARRDRPALTQETAAGIAAAGLLTAAFFLLTLRSQRHIEYFVPFLLLFDALLATAVASVVDFEALRRRLQPVFGRWRWLVARAMPVFLVFFALTAARDIQGVRREFNEGIAWVRYARAGTWLRDNAAPGTIVFHSDWDDFPILFYQDDRLRYIAGLDPTFFYRADRSRYELWRDITTGQTTAHLGRTVVESFDAWYLFIEKGESYAKLLRAAAQDTTLRLAYEDDEAAIYQVAGTP